MRFSSVPLLATLLLLQCPAVFSQTETETLRVKVEQMPFFAGCQNLKNDDPAKRACSDKALAEFVAGHLRYPDSAANARLEGTVIVSFVVDENGKASQETVLRDIGSGCGEAAKNIVRAMPNWEAAQHQGKKVKVKLTLPVRFALKISSPDEAKSFSIHWGKLRGDRVPKSILQECLNEQLYVRDAFGTAVQVSELTFSFEKKRKTSEAKISGATLDAKMRKIVRKVSPGGTFTVSAAVQREGKFIIVEKSFLVE